MPTKCSVRRCNNEKDGFCTIIPEIITMWFDGYMGDDVVSDPYPVCKSIETERKEKEYIEKKVAEYSNSLKKRYGS